LHAARPPAPGVGAGPGPLVAELRDGLLAWVEGNLARFALGGAGDGADGGPPAGHKPLAELVLMCALVRRALGPARAARTDALAAFARAELVRAGCDEHLARNPHLLLAYATMEVGLRGCGQEIPALRRVVQQVVDGGHATAHERLPYRTMDLAHVLQAGGYRHPFPPVEELYRATLLASCPSPLWLRTQEVYQATHTLFYLADYGLSPQRLAGHPDLPRLRGMVESLLGVHLRQRDWDLVAELLMDCCCVGHAPEPLVSAAWQALHDAWRTHGVVPSAGFDPSARDRMDPEAWERHRFEESYHTALVTILACAAWEASAPAPRAPAAAAEPGTRRQRPRLDGPRLERAFAQAAGWLASAIEAPGLSGDDRLHAALGLACAAGQAGDAAAGALGRALPAFASGDLLACDPMAVVLLDRAVAPALRAPALAEAAATILAVCRQAPVPPGVRHHLLAAEGLLDLPQEPGAWSRALHSPFAPRDEVLLAAARLQALGPGAADALAAAPLAALTLEAALQEALMLYDLEAGMAILVALARAGGRAGPLEDALRFLLTQQHPDGFFGFQPPAAGEGGLAGSRRVRTTALACWTLRAVAAAAGTGPPALAPPIAAATASS
jgi:hypothetical protein